MKGSLCPPEKLITEKRVSEIKSSLSTQEGEKRIFQYLDQAIHSTSHLKQKIVNYPGQILQKEDIIAALSLVEQFYLGFRNQVTTLVRAILEKERINIAYGSETDALEYLLEPKAIMMSDIFNQHWAYRISRNKAEKILTLDTHGRNLQSNLNDPAAHRVISFPEHAPEPLVFFKANGNPSIRPEKEFMLYSLYRQLQIPVPETALVILTDVFETNPNYFYAAQASEAVLGESSLKAFKDPEEIFDLEAYVLQVIGALLTNPSDGSFQNFKYSPKYKSLISIDNDKVFKLELGSQSVVNVKSILYLLDKIDLPFPDSSKTFFTTLDPHLTVLAWLQDLSKKNKEYSLLFTKLAFQNTRCIYQNLLPGDEVPNLAITLHNTIFVDPKLHCHVPFFPQIFVTGNLLKNVSEKLQIIETTLLQNNSISTQTLFQEISVLGKYYRKLRFKFNDPEETLEALWGVRKNGVDYSKISSLLNNQELSSLPKIQSELNENQVPETFFKYYKEKLESKDTPLDRFIRRHNERHRKNALNLQAALIELQFLIQQKLTNSRSILDIVEFYHNLSKIIDNNYLIKEITSLLSNLPHPKLKWLLTLEERFLRIDRPFPKDRIPFSLIVDGTFMKQRRFALTESENRYLFDRQGNINRHPSLTGRSLVTYFPEDQPEFYLKQFPELPGYELASNLLMRLLGIQHLPYQDLIIIDSQYPVLLTQKVDGDPVFRIWHKPEAFRNLDPFHTGLLIIAAILINPEDGKEDNFILSPDGKYLIPIDNDHCFLPSTFQKEGGFWNPWTINTALQTKTLLFCLPEMKEPIFPEVRKHILSLDFNSLLTSWLTELISAENLFNNLVNQEQRSTFLKNGTLMGIPFYEQFIDNLYWKANKIQDLLKSPSEQTPLSLLKAMEPFAARCYQKSFQIGDTLEGRFKAATIELYSRKTGMAESRMSILNTQSMMRIINISERDLHKIGPSEALGVLKQLIQERDSKRKIEQDLICELDERNQERKFISLFGSSPVEKSLKAFFTDPKEGLILKGSTLSTVSKFVDLFGRTPAAGVKIRFLSLPESPSLTEREIRILATECPNIEYLNVNGCAKLNEIATGKKEWPLLARLEARECLNLKRLVSHSPMRILRITTENKIEIIAEKSTPDIFTISTKANQFDFTLKKGENLEITSYGEVMSLQSILHLLSEEEKFKKYFRGLKISIGRHSILSGKDLGIFITSINLENSNIKAEHIKTIIQFKLKNLNWLNLSGNQIRTDSLKYLIQGDWPKLSHLDLSSKTLGDQEIQMLVQGNWPLLETLNLTSPKVTKKGLLNFLLDINWPNVQKITVMPDKKNFTRNLLKNNWHLLKELDLRSGEITHNEIWKIINGDKLPKLKHLNLSYNFDLLDEVLQILVQGNWPELETLNLEFTGVTKKGLLNFISNINWPKIKEITFKFESHTALMEDFTQNFLENDWHLLDLSSSEITQNEIEAIVNRLKLPKLEILNLSDSGILDEGLVILSQGNWPLLQSLKLGQTRVTAVGIEALVKRSNWLQLREIDLSFCQIYDEGLQILSQGNWPLLQSFKLRQTRVTAVGIEALIKRSNWLQLREIDLSFCQINDEELHILSQGNWPLLSTINVNSTGVTQRGVLDFILKTNCLNLRKVFFGSHQEEKQIGGYLPLIEELNLSSWGVTQNEIEVLVKESKWTRFKHLDLSNNSKINDEGIEILTQGNWPLLETLNLSSINITRKGLLNFLRNANWPKFRNITLSKVWDSVPENLVPFLIRKDLSLLERFEFVNLDMISTDIEIILNPRQCQKLKYLNLSDNDISFEGFSILAIAECFFLEELHLKNTRLSPEGIKIIVDQSKWPLFKHLNVSSNEIFDEGLTQLTRGQWLLLEELNLKDTKITQQGIKVLVDQMKLQNLKKLDISGNKILDEGLEILASGEWSSFQHLVYCEIKATQKGNIALLESPNWPNLQHLEHSLSESFFIFDETSEKWLPSEIVRTIVPMNYEAQPLLVIALDIAWKAQKDIRLSALHFDHDEKIMLLTPDMWDQLEEIQTLINESSKIEPLQPLIWPSNLKRLNLHKTDITEKSIESLINISDWSRLKKLDISSNPIKNEGLEVVASAKWQLLEDLNLQKTDITTTGVESLIRIINWSNLKRLDISGNSIENQGLEMLIDGKWDLLEYLNLRSTKITAEGIEILNRSDWPKLTELDISDNLIGNEGLKLLSCGKWSRLEYLYLIKIGLTEKGIEDMSSGSEWPYLKVLDVSWNKKVFDARLGALASGKWPLLECLSLNFTNLTLEDVKLLIEKSSWPNFKEIHLTQSFHDDTINTLILGKWPNLKLYDKL